MDKLPNPFVLDPECDFPRGFDPRRFLDEITEPLPESFVSPTRAFLIGCGLEPVIEILDAC